MDMDMDMDMGMDIEIMERFEKLVRFPILQFSSIFQKKQGDNFSNLPLK